MKWPTKKLKYQDVPIYDVRIWLTDSLEVWNECMDVLGCEHQKPGSNGLFAQLQDNKTGITVFIIGVFDESAKTLLHETAHCTFSILDYVGVDVKEGSNEAYCYLLEYIFEGWKGKFKI